MWDYYGSGVCQCGHLKHIHYNINMVNKKERRIFNHGSILRGLGKCLDCSCKKYSYATTIEELSNDIRHAYYLNMFYASAWYKLYVFISKQTKRAYNRLYRIRENYRQYWINKLEVDYPE